MPAPRVTGAPSPGWRMVLSGGILEGVKSSDPAVTDLLRGHGLRPTRASRLIIARLRHSNDHLSADEIRRALRRRGHDISIATLYQNLKRLTRAGLLDTFADTDGLVRFDANTESHTHLVCAECGRIADMPGGRRSPMAPPVPVRRYRGWLVRTARLELCGLCPRCRH